MEDIPYNKFNALVFETLIFLERFYPKIRLNPWVIRAKDNCHPDWTEFRTGIVMAKLEKDFVQLHEEWDIEEKKANAPLYTREQNGKVLRITAPWVLNRDSDSV